MVESLNALLPMYFWLGRIVFATRRRRRLKCYSALFTFGDYWFVDVLSY